METSRRRAPRCLVVGLRLETTYEDGNLKDLYILIIHLEKEWLYGINF